VKNQRNMITAMLLTLLLVFGWESAMRYIWPEKAKPHVAASVAPAPKPSQSAAPTREGGLSSAIDKAVEAKVLAADLASGGRVPIVAPGLVGSINLNGAVIDDLSTPRFGATVEKNSGNVRLFSPAGTPAQQFAQLGWVAQGVATPNGATVWSAPAGAKLTPQTPVTLSWVNPTGQTFTIRLAIDSDYMITATQGVTNAGRAPVSVQPFALVNRTDKTASADSWQIHSGPFGAFEGAVAFTPSYADVAGADAGVPASAQGFNVWGFFKHEPPYAQGADNGRGVLRMGDGKTDWLGFTDVYWMSVLVPDAKGVGASSAFRSLGGGLYRADLMYKPQVVAPGQAASITTRLFAGAKESLVLDKYEASGITNFGLAIDWGWFRWFEKPIFWLLRSLFHLTGNFGVAIIALTVVVRAIMFPVAQRQFASAAAMKTLQPKLKAVQERHKGDAQKIQEETMKLYKEEGVNPLAGCLPIFLQIPIFFALYKVLMVSIDMRHQPFILWIRDLSAPDPLHIINLFGLLPFEPPSLLAVGVLALILGGTMWFQFRLQPAAPDPAQQQMMAIMPWMMMFFMAPLASGLLVYYIFNNLISIGQQRFLYARHPQMKAMVDKERADVAAATKSARNKP
jgi:YidC/Oxa1 family membrane protein insertase